MHQIIEIDPQKRLARVQPGTILDNLRHAAEQFHHARLLWEPLDVCLVRKMSL